VRVPPGRPLSERPEAVAPDAPAPGRLRVHSVLSRAPLRVRQVEALLRARRTLTTAPDRHVATLDLQFGAPGN
jgi:hypothetical protein